MRVLLGISQKGKAVVYSGNDEAEMQYILEIAKRADIAVQEVDVTEEQLLEIMEDNSSIESITSEIRTTGAQQEQQPSQPQE